MSRKAIFALLLAASLAGGPTAFPASAHAAQFAKQSLFLSQSSVTEGETVLIHAVVSNDTANAFAGTLAFSDDGAAIGSVPVTLKAGEGAVMSVSWKPAAGSHPISATLKDAAGATVESQQKAFTVAAKPAPVPADAAASAAVVESSKGIQSAIGGVSPATEAYSAPIFNTLDSARTSAADTLDSQLSATRARLAPDSPGEVLGAEAVKNSPQNPAGGFMYLLNTLYFYLLTLLRFVIGSAAVFYPVFAIALLYVLWRGFRLVRRPRY